ncbi:MAG: hypothetical protein IJW05_12285 [Lentisphaeria bacterium]|nr:hypothetical protein [Lentisphaeria bacterium]
MKYEKYLLQILKEISRKGHFVKFHAEQARHPEGSVFDQMDAVERSLWHIQLDGDYLEHVTDYLKVPKKFVEQSKLTKAESVYNQWVKSGNDTECTEGTE